MPRGEPASAWQDWGGWWWCLHRSGTLDCQGDVPDSNCKILDLLNSMCVGVGG